MNKQKKIIIIAGLAVILVGIFAYFRWNSFSYIGTIEATKVDIPARVSSLIAEVSVREGDKVIKGDKLLLLSCEDILIDAESALSDYSRADKLYKEGSMAKESFDHAKTRNDMSNLKKNWCQVEAPLEGVVLSRYHEPGEMVSPGMKLFTLADLNNVWAYIYVSAADMARLKTSQKLLATLPELENKKIEGTIIKINDEAEFTPRNVQTKEERARLVFGVKVQFENRENLLKPGMTVEVFLE